MSDRKRPGGRSRRARRADQRTASIYARYSSDQQSETSIDDQVFSCRRYADDHGFRVLPDRIYSDVAVSGAQRDRDGLSAMMAAAELGVYKAVLVYDFSRVARDLHHLLGIAKRLRSLDIGIWSVTDGINTLDDATILHFQIQGAFAEHQLNDLRKRTKRGQLGQKRRGGFVGEVVFGFESFRQTAPSIAPAPGAGNGLTLMRPNPKEVPVVHRIYGEFADGAPMTAIARDLNRDCIAGRYTTSKGWTASTIGRMLSNEKYIGRWIWNKTRGVRDPDTGKRRDVDNAESEWCVVENESLRIIDQGLWERVQRRRGEIRATYKAGQNRRGYSDIQGRRVEVYPTHLLSGSMHCDDCGGAIALVSGKPPGYYGCIAQQRAACDNRVLVQRPVAEKVIFRELLRQLREPDVFARILQAAEKEARRLFKEVPARLRVARRELKEALKSQGEYLRFIREGYQSKAVAHKLAEIESTVERLQKEVSEIERASKAVFKAPSVEWLSERLGKLRSVLDQRVGKSALLFRRLAGPIKLVPVRPATGRPYYTAHMSLNTLALLDDPDTDDDPDSGSKSLHWWTWFGSNFSFHSLKTRHRAP